MTKDDYMAIAQRAYAKIQADKIQADDRMLKWFDYDNFPKELQKVAAHFHLCATAVVSQCQPGPERTVALRKLLEGLDAAVRAVSHPGG